MKIKSINYRLYRSVLSSSVRHFGVVLLFILFSVYAQVPAQQKAPEFNLAKFHLVMLKKGPMWGENEKAEMRKATEAHISYVRGLIDTGKAALAAGVGNEGSLRGVVILNTESSDEARAAAESDPAVKAGLFSIEIHPWFAEKGIMKPSASTDHAIYYLGFLRRGPKWTPARTPETEKIQAGHMANIQKMAKMGKLVIAGPFGDDGELRGIFVFKTDSANEANSLAAADPAIQADRLVLELHTLMVAKGALP